MFIINTIEHICNSPSNFGAKLEETSIQKRKIFTGNESSHKNCYSEIIRKLNEEIKDKELGCFLREIWKKHENELRVGNYEAEEAYCEYNKKIKKWEVHINLKRDIEDSKWLKGYHTIFHEFFHNIYKVAGLMDMDLTKQFGETVISDIRNLLNEEKKASAKDETLLRKITHKTDKKYKAALYDIIGAEFYKGKYGCNPASDSSPRNKCKYKYSCLALCEYTFTCEGKPNANNTCPASICKPGCRFKRYCTNKNKICNYRIECKLETNEWCDEIYGHVKSYWEKGIFSDNLAEETFALMAAEAIVNFEAYEKIKECLPKSEKIFEKILEKMSSKKEHIEYWVQQCKSV